MDLDISIFKKANTNEENIASVEAFNVFDILRARHNSIETLEFFINFIHDRDFSYLINNILNNYRKQKNKLEQLSKKHNIKIPIAPPEKIKISAQLDQITDKFIFRKIYSDLIYELFSLNRGITSSTFNDNLRDLFVNFTLSHLEDFNTLYKYGKLKSWIEVSPSYKTYKSMEKEQLSAIEANHLWDHLNLRYDQLNYTRIFKEFVHDYDLKKILQTGEKTLKKQIKVLQEKSNLFEVPTPEQPSPANEANIDPEIIEDKFIFRVIFKGIQEAINLHIRAIIESVVNDSLRKLFLNYFKEETNLFSNYLKYGKMKGWTHIPPIYKKT